MFKIKITYTLFAFTYTEAKFPVTSIRALVRACKRLQRKAVSNFQSPLLELSYGHERDRKGEQFLTEMFRLSISEISREFQIYRTNRHYSSHRFIELALLPPHFQLNLNRVLSACITV